MLLPFIYFKVSESPVWLAARECKESAVILPVIRTHWRLCVYLVVLMACFSFFSHGTQDLYLTFLKGQHGFDPYTVSLITIDYNIAAMLEGSHFVLYWNVLALKAMITALLLAFSVLPVWAFSSGSLTTGIGGFPM